MRLEWKIGGQRDGTVLRTWSVTVTEDVGVSGDEEPMFCVHGDFGEEFRGNTTDLSRALYHLAGQQSRSFRVGDDRMPKRVTWTLHLLGGDHQTLDSKGADWKPDKERDAEAEAEEDADGSLVERPADDREILLQIIRDQRTRIKELEELHATQVQLLISGMGSLTQQSTALMESHTSNALNLAQGVVTTVGENFDLMRSRMLVELEGDDEEDFLSTPMGQVIAGHIPDLLEQAPGVLAAFGQWLMSLAEKKAGA